MPNNTISFSNGTQVRYFYSADGTKLRQTVKSFNSTEPPVLAIRQRSDYLGPVHYEDPDGDGAAQRVLLFAQHEEGRIRPSGGEILYEYVLTDHLGNTRITFGDADADGDPDLLQENHYYPFGLAMTLSGTTAAAPPNNYLYNGKELQDELGLYDYGFRFYDPGTARFISVDPLASERSWVSPYNFVQNNPINRVDPKGALDDWVQDADGNIKWDKNANSQATTKEGESYLGKTLTFKFNSYIEEKLWDGPGGSGPAGDKLTSTISLTGIENEVGELTGLTATKSVKIGATPVGTARDYFPGLDSDQNKFSFSETQHTNGLLTSTTLNFEQHASVSPIEAFGLGILGYDIVNVAQNLQLSLSGNQLSVTAATDIFPSATLTMNGSQMMYYPQPSFEETHGSQRISGFDGIPFYVPLRPAPSFHIRFKR